MRRWMLRESASGAVAGSCAGWNNLSRVVECAIKHTSNSASAGNKALVLCGKYWWDYAVDGVSSWAISDWIVSMEIRGTR